MDRLPKTAIHQQQPATSRASRSGSGNILAFLHIPKCAGTSIMDSIALGIGPGRHVRGFDRCLFGDFSQFDSIPKMMRGVIHLDKTELPLEATTVMGHFSYQTLRGRYPNADFVVLLREPTVRLLSHWIYWRSLTWFSLRHWGAEWSARLKLARLPLQAFLSHPDIACQTDNIITRMLVWPHPLIPDNQFIDPANDAALLAIACENLEHFGFAGITERKAAGYRELSDWLGFRLDVPSLNPARKMRRSVRSQMNTELADGTLRLLAERSRLDAKLWMLLATRKMTETEAGRLRQTAILQAVARFSILLA
jgi:hypothetical protein